MEGQKLRDAAKSGDIETVKKIVKESPTSVNYKDRTGYTPLHMASMYVFKLWFNMHDSLSLTQKISFHQSSCSHHHMINRFGHKDIIQILLENGADKTAVSIDGEDAEAVAKGLTIVCRLWRGQSGSQKGSEGSVNSRIGKGSSYQSTPPYQPFSI
ncbi:hypothetical protein DFA_10125 [Cavenderia fasciculata]|uniref:Ankyrin repeat-containing protein n=1 Tax=Cavenderia fasciculata TaxID=261658 RepID=F4Q9C2_CACFS|nr:uncharacterized protein DFA_10125 [Cavenderia fasciculata]EGG15291.1 hypothetical protein DFA_10125 [Cavenderia fasciculata]|eukprot:XP_004352011.1 hypothetical protein DFA_10125 [Cavenderia fasciculata]